MRAVDGPQRVRLADGLRRWPDVGFAMGKYAVENAAYLYVTAVKLDGKEVS
jgi:hypothetical protein